MKFRETEISGAWLVEPAVLRDERGEFFRTLDSRLLAEATGIGKNFVQHNHSVNKQKGTWRGFHYQLPPMTETKMIRCTAGAVLDFVLDLREGSPTFLNWRAFELSAANRLSLIIPDGCAHGFLTLADDSELLYYHTEFYDPKSEAGIRFDDPRLAAALPADIRIISERDCSFPFLSPAFKGLSI